MSAAQKTEKRLGVVDRAIVAGGGKLAAAPGKLWRRLPGTVRAGLGVGAVLALLVGVEARQAVLGAAVGVLVAVAVPVGVWQTRRRGFLAFLWRRGAPEKAAPEAEAVIKRWDELTAKGSPLAPVLTGSTPAAGPVDGVSWSLGLELPPGRTVDEVQNLRGPLESAFKQRRGSLRVVADEMAHRVQLRVIHRDLLAEPMAWVEPQSKSVLRPIHLGRFEDGEGCDLHLLPAAGAGRNLAIAGQPGSGKSGLLNLIIAALVACRDVALVGVDPQAVELAPWQECFADLALEADAAEPVLRNVVRTMEVRNRKLRVSGARVWTPSERDPALVVVVDEGGAVASCMGLLEEIASRGRKLAVLVIFATQRPSSASLGDRGKEFLSRCQSRIALRLADATDVDIALGRGGAREGWRADQVLRRRGEFLLRDDDHPTVRVARGPYVGDPDVERWAAACAPNRPRLEDSRSCLN